MPPDESPHPRAFGFPVPKKPAIARSNADWEAVERAYRAGLKSLREIGLEHGVSHAAIRKRAARDGWDRDLSAKIKAKADALVSRAEVSSEVSTERAETDRIIVEANAEAIARVRLSHRKDIARARMLAMNLLAELEQTAEAVPLIERLEALVATDADADEKEQAKRAALLQKVLELPTRTATMKALAETMTKLIALEREAYSLAGEDPDKRKDSAGDQIADLLRQIDGAGTGLPNHAEA